MKYKAVLSIYYSLHNKDLSKGLSFNSPGPLNMRMGLNDFSANDVINKLNTIELEKSLDFLVKKKKQKNS